MPFAIIASIMLQMARNRVGQQAGTQSGYMTAKMSKAKSGYTIVAVLTY
jgi:hypothetical protein